MRIYRELLFRLTFRWQCLHTGALTEIGSRQFGQDIQGLAIGGEDRDSSIFIPKTTPTAKAINTMRNTTPGSIVSSVFGKVERRNIMPIV